MAIQDIDDPRIGQRKTFDEIALYTVAGGEIVEERFFYGS